nr:phospholipase-like protein [Tanacetum cinerariifolium]
LASGLKPNMNKSTIFFGSVIPIEKKRIMKIIRFIKGIFPIEYFGIPLASIFLIPKTSVKEIEKVKDSVIKELYNCKVTIRSRPSMILFIKERLSITNKRLKLFIDTVFGKYLDIDVEDNDNHLLNYVLHHQRPVLSKSIDSNLVFDIAGHTLVFERSEFCLVTSFACGKVVFPEYMDDDIPPFLRRVFLDKEKKLENKASLGKAEAKL